MRSCRYIRILCSLNLRSLSLVLIHMADIFYLQPNLSFGTSPVSDPTSDHSFGEHPLRSWSVNRSFQAPLCRPAKFRWSWKLSLPLKLPVSSSEEYLQNCPSIASNQCGRSGMRTSLKPLEFPTLQQSEPLSTLKMTMDAS
ncbi:hypothetical protein N7523_002227 [Penicillium sp. IBT 18751x]|nr:hypothetical protein N7523_002227 [Penicillium sp. IBT 18751x]